MDDEIILTIGRDADQNRLAVRKGNQILMFGAPDSVPTSVSRYIKEEGRSHACIIIDPVTQKIRITNSNPHNYTWVEDHRVTDEEYPINWESQITLGADYYHLDLPRILRQIGLRQPVSIRHLEMVWSKYDRQLMELTAEQAQKANRQRLQGIITGAAMILTLGSQTIHIDGEKVSMIVNIIRFILYAACVIFGIYIFLDNRNTKNSFQARKRELDEKFQQQYVCPRCNAFLGYKAYHLFQHSNRCGNCSVRLSTDD